jgi:hypothetical protein
MDRIEKFLRQLGRKDPAMMVIILADIRNLALGKYEIKPLRGFKGVYRLRKGRIRVVFAKIDGMGKFEAGRKYFASAGWRLRGVLIDINYRPQIYRGL